MNPLFREASTDPASDGGPLLQPQMQITPAGASGVGSQAALALDRRIALNQLTTLRWPLPHDLDEYVRNGIPAIGVNWRKLCEFGIRRSVRRIQQSGLPVSSLGWIGGFTGEHGYPLSDVLKEARRMIRVANQIGARTLTVVTGPQGGHIRSHATRIIVDALRELVPFAATHGVVLALQPMHSLFSRNWSFLNTLDESLAVMDRVDDPRLKLSFGTYHLWEESGLLNRIPEVAPRIAIVKLADWGDSPRHENDQLLPGEGRIPLLDVIQSLENQGYSGWYELKVWSRDLWKLDHRDLMRRCVAAQHALSTQFAAR